MRAEITQIHRKVGATTIYVTHDQTEAMTMADRIVVMKDGYVQQIGTPYELYFNPANQFVAGCIGETPMYFMECVNNGASFSCLGEQSQGMEYSKGFPELAAKKVNCILGCRAE